MSKESVCNAEDAGDWDLTLSQEEPLEESMVTHSYILTWKIPWIWRLADYSPLGHKALDMTK